MRRESRFRIGTISGEFTWFPRSSTGISFGLATGESGAFHFSLRIYLCALFIGWGSYRLRSALEKLTKRKDERYGNGREFTVYWFDGGLWWALWHDPMESRSADPWYMKMHKIDVRDILLGRSVYDSKVLKTERVVVPMPEGGYPATVDLTEDSWKRPRWPWPKVVKRAQIVPDTPIPFPGKGENSWDCGEDATHSLTCAAKTGLDAAMSLSRSVMESRIRYGSGWNYKTKEKTLCD